MARKESACLVAYDKLAEVIRLAGKNGQMTIPSERTLAEGFRVSRMTLRKAIYRALENGLLQKADRSYIVRANTMPVTRTTIVFISPGIGTPGNQVWARVFSQLTTLGARQGFAVTPLLTRARATGFFTNEDEARRTLTSADIVVIAGNPQEDLTLIPLRDGQPRIFLDEQARPAGAHLVTLDNYQLGCLAATHLLARNCQRPLYIGGGLRRPYRPFLQREKGFLQTIKEKTGRAAQSWWLSYLPDLERLQQLESFAARVAREKIDGVFYFSDDRLAFFREQLLIHVHGDLPELVTLLGNGDLSQQVISLDYFDHAEERIAAGVIELVGAQMAGRLPACVTKYVAPEFHRQEEWV